MAAGQGQAIFVFWLGIQQVLMVGVVGQFDRDRAVGGVDRFKPPPQGGAWLLPVANAQGGGFSEQNGFTFCLVLRQAQHGDQ